MNIIDKSYLSAGSVGVRVCEGMMIKGAKIDSVKLTVKQMCDFLTSKLPSVLQGMFDNNYYLTDIETWKIISEYDWTRYKKYLDDKWDCDNMALAFATHISELYDISVSVIYGDALNASTGVLVNRHYWFLIVSMEPDGTKHLWYFDPGNSALSEVFNQNDVTMGGLIYRIIPGISKLLYF